MTTTPSTLRDNFEDGSIADCWSAGGVVGSATRTETSGQARFTLPSSTAGAHQAYHRTPFTMNLTGDGFVINIQTMVATGVAATMFFEFFLDASNKLSWTQLSGTLKAQTTIAGAVVDRFSASWNATNHKYLRIRESGGNILWDTSADGVSFTNRASLAIPFAITALTLQFGVSCGNIASPGSLRLDDVNLILPALSTNWRWVQQKWPFRWRFRNTTEACDAANTVQGYIVTADEVDASGNPTTNVRYWSGPMSDGRTLTEQTTGGQSAAQAMAVNVPLDGRLDLPTMIEGRIIRTYLRSIDGASFVLRELYSRRLGQFDDLEAEIIRGMTISGHQFIVDELSALTADVGELTSGIIDGVTIYAGSGNEVALDNSGVTIEGDSFIYNLSNLSPVTIPRANQIQWTESTASQPAAIMGSDDGQLLAMGDRITLAIPISASDSYGLDLDISGAHRMDAASFAVTAGGSTAPVAFQVTTDVVSGANSTTAVKGGLNVGSASGATQGQVKASAGIFPSSGTGSMQIQTRDIASLANNGTAQLVNATGDQFGMVLVIDANNGHMALFTLRGAAHATQEVSDPGAVYSATAGTAASTNVYWSGANSRYEIENKIGSTQTYHVIFFSYT